MSVLRSIGTILSYVFALALAAWFSVAIATALWNMFVSKELQASDTLDAIGKQWIAKLEVFGVLLFAAGFVIAIACRLLQFPNGDIAFAAGLVGSLVVTLVFHCLFYHLVKCPTCGKKLNKYKNGRNMPIKNAFTALRKGDGCKWCGWKPTAVVEKTTSGA